MKDFNEVKITWSIKYTLCYSDISMKGIFSKEAIKRKAVWLLVF